MPYTFQTTCFHWPAMSTSDPPTSPSIFLLSLKNQVVVVMGIAVDIIMASVDVSNGEKTP